MRSALTTILGEHPHSPSAHAGLLHERYVKLVYEEPPGTPERDSKIGKIDPPRIQEALLDDVASLPISTAYQAAWRRWRAALEDPNSGAVTRVVETSTRLLLGHGNPAPSEVAITLHHVYGVPLIPGTALKGLLNHYLSCWGRPVDDEWRGVGYDEKGRPKEPSGLYHRAIFGAPNLPLGDGGEQEGQSGGVVFEDAWLIPEGDTRPLCTDVLTPHQGDYYRRFGEQEPNDWTDPNPVTFLTVKPKTRFLLAVSGLTAGREGAELAMAHLVDALEQWGIGAKTRAGYGRLTLAIGTGAAAQERTKRDSGTPVMSNASMSSALHALKNAVAAVLEPPNKDAAPPVASRLDQHITDALLDALEQAELPHARAILRGIFEHAGLKKRRKDRLKAIHNQVSK